jgi:hypothetical protein
MVYIPYKMLHEKAMKKYEESLIKNPTAPKPNGGDIILEWYRLMEWIPKNDYEFDQFIKQFPASDRNNIKRTNLPQPTRFAGKNFKRM